MIDTAQEAHALAVEAVASWWSPEHSSYGVVRPEIVDLEDTWRLFKDDVFVFEGVPQHGRLSQIPLSVDKRTGRVWPEVPLRKPDLAPAPQLLTAISKAHVGPVMRAAGFRGTAKRYKLNAPDHLAGLSIGAGRSSSNAAITQFDLGGFAVSRADWAAYTAAHGLDPKIHPWQARLHSWPPEVWSWRIERPGIHQFLFALFQGIDPHPVASAVLAAIEQEFLPGLRHVLGRA